MAIYITVDMGTSNTRLSLVREGAVTDTVAYAVGADGASTKDTLARTLREGIATLLRQSALPEEAVERILASGMITSEGGLCPLAHVRTPCGIGELSQSMHECTLPEVSKVPFVLSRGVMTDSEELARLDMLRGEETELFGLAEHLSPSCTYVLPGTHTKLLSVDAQGRLWDIVTTMSGELLHALCTHTVLRGSISLDCREVDEVYLLRGYAYAEAHGVSAAAFKVRILDRMCAASATACYSFFLGAVLQGDVALIRATDTPSVAVGGKAALRTPLVALLRAHTTKEITELSDETAHAAAARGLVRLYEARKTALGE